MIWADAVPFTMKLEHLIQALDAPVVIGSEAKAIEGITYDSRLVKVGWLFVAICGSQQDGQQFITDALDRGAIAVVSEAAVPVPRSVTHIQVANAQVAIAQLASTFQHHPGRALHIAGITGTNGKTTTAYCIRSILEAAERLTGLVGTVEYRIGERSLPAARTTPEATELQCLLSRMVKHGCDAAVMEVSSHALDQHRVDCIPFDVGVFTNLTRDHLDYHGDLESYFQAKAKLFTRLGNEGKTASGLVNTDDPWGRRLMEHPEVSVPVLSYGLNPEADVRAEEPVFHAHGLSFKLKSPWGEADVCVPMLGRFNLHNVLAAIGTCGLLGVDLDLMVTCLAQIESAPGRLERVDCPVGGIYVDYAHTEDALDNVLKTLSELVSGRLIVVFGCGGNRDTHKRAAMGRVASKWADESIITNDNPRKEDPQAIATEILSGVEQGHPVEVILDRKDAIQHGIGRLQEGDILLIAGKGHETTQEFADTLVPFDDRQVVRRLLRNV